MSTENNILIAEFAGLRKVNNVRNEDGKKYDFQLTDEFPLIIEQEIQVESNNGWGLVSQDYAFGVDLLFHSDWNWLMQVVDKAKAVPEPNYELLDAIDDALICVEIDSVYNACVEFIKWYNEIPREKRT